jgi:hypothetical protein
MFTYLPIYATTPAIASTFLYLGATKSKKIFGGLWGERWLWGEFGERENALKVWVFLGVPGYPLKTKRTGLSDFCKR